MFIGFIDIDDILHAVIQQPFIITDGQASLDDIRLFWSIMDLKIHADKIILIKNMD